MQSDETSRTDEISRIGIKGGQGRGPKELVRYAAVVAVCVILYALVAMI